MSMMKAAALAVLVLAAGAKSANAQGLAFGIQGSYALDSEAAGVGLRLESDIGSKLASSGFLSRALFVGSFDYFFPDGFDMWEANAGLAVGVGTSSMRPYVGAGLRYASFDVDCEGSFCDGVDTSSSDTGLNIFGGIHIGSSSLKPFVEARYELGDASQLVLTGGIMLGGKR